MISALVQAYTSALRAMEDGAPRGLVRRAQVEADDLDPGLDVSEARLRAHLAASGPDDKLRLDLHLNLAKWDNAPVQGNSWAGGTEPNTEERRARVIEALQLGPETAAEIARHFPLAKGDGTTVIAGPWDPWYTEEVKRARDFYWGHYVDYLRTRRGWHADAIANLDTATTRVVERLIDPSRSKAGQTKGLVVGYVQSGKTANFTGVIAKAIDAGYRLVIVMTGTTNILREQTQRRLDMELVGRENILRGTDENDPDAAQFIDYLDDEDWIADRFVRHGAWPSEIGRPDIHRMTNRRFDYRRLQQGRSALEFERRDRTKPLWHPENLFTSDARLIIVKKNTTVLNNLVKDLKNTADRLENIPALIIDDESDQASINTTDPRKWYEDKKERTAINKHLSTLLRLLPRAQYIGYTATPFANVFVDPTDAEDIFPKDYLISLERPLGYMGAEDFHDLDLDPDVERNFRNSKEKAHLRLLDDYRDDEDDSKLRAALDSFVLAAAIKLYREAEGSGHFKHHTMLVHETMRTADQRERAAAIQYLWRGAGYLSGRAHDRLRTLFENDFAPVSEALALGYAMPSRFDELTRFLGEAVRKIAPNGNPVLVVNSDKDIEQEDLDFDKRSVWRVLVGGNKLARGFTIEGLTITYYSRKVKHAEALMQMGRWFGFRKGYRDLVRLFITPDVRDAFEAACRDEEHFRNELRQYATMVDGRPVFTPYDIPPLVTRHGLRPTAANKMYNARLVERRTPTKEPSSGYPLLTDQAALDHNIDACVPLLKAAQKVVSLPAGNRTFEAFLGEVSHQEMVSVLSELKWARPDTFTADLAWIASLREEVIDRWDIMLPQQKTGRRVNIRGIGEFTVHGRTVGRDESIRGNSESAHRVAIKDIPGRTPTSGCAILYPVMKKNELDRELVTDGYPTRLVMALMLQLPDGAVPADRRPLVYQVVVPEKPLYAIVEA
ncbi:Z1 domain-containing protein [Goodfellowiella coeruleoviolacea]|uniref:Z1 domain-containing protein n=1 Tax=Goodfellowiella coeruleoviolacea TaxID=334858 RepID=A0AAE3GKW9_9PSEU|nr:Z1 domain-containing protein [Goodfellowiella coeruleoviolacea]MCP2169149.1 Z1 domain-containing protein [Goodfellowiella coeruleoviolacea]